MGLHELRGHSQTVSRDGHREKTFQLLWTIMFGCQLNTILDLVKLEEIVYMKNRLLVTVRIGDGTAQERQAWLIGLMSTSTKHSRSGYPCGSQPDAGDGVGPAGAGPLPDEGAGPGVSVADI